MILTSGFDGTPSNPTSNSDKSLHPWHLHPLRLVCLFSCGHQFHHIVYLIDDLWSLQIGLTVLTSRMLLTPSYYHFQTLDWGMGMEVEGMVAPDLFYIDCSSDPSGDGGVIADGPN